MNSGCNWSRYRDRLERVVGHIHAHLDDDLDYEAIAEIACLSPWHWHRIYKGVYGETVTATVKRLRLQRAAADLANSALPVSAVARRAGYPSVQSFTRVFKASFGMAPAAYRAGGSHTRFETVRGPGEALMYDVETRQTEGFRVAGVPHTGAYMGIGGSFERLYGLLFSEGLHRPDMRMVGIYFDDPDIVAEDRLRALAGVTVGPDFAAKPPIEIVDILKGTYAVLTHKGPYADMPKAYRWLFGPWLETSGREVADKPALEVYLNTPRDTAPTELLTEIWMPLKED